MFSSGRVDVSNDKWVWDVIHGFIKLLSWHSSPSNLRVYGRDLLNKFVMLNCKTCGYSNEYQWEIAAGKLRRIDICKEVQKLGWNSNIFDAY